MFLIRLVWWLLTLPIRLGLFAVGVALWIVTLPLRIVFGTLGLIGLGRIAQLTVLGAVGYFFYKLVNPDADDLLPPAPTQAELNKVPST